MASLNSNNQPTPQEGDVPEYAALCSELSSAKDEITSLKRRVQWFEKQLFGQKSEKRIEQNPDQLSLLTKPVQTPAVEEDKVQITYKRGKTKKQRPEECVTDSGLRFSEDVPVQVIRVEPPELQGEHADH